ncbi:hypothetical protein CF055_00010 [Clostridium botulinum]|uniref:hypothetical protein n=1 Tax=Clostridium botulinum TaxID=1491 RepID=UPI000A16CEAE|nr:hypothetical protein [Clostridium botulinum]OSB09006.1 hypothetical protein B2H96_17615 [Clostridium botulinum]
MFFYNKDITFEVAEIVDKLEEIKCVHENRYVQVPTRALKVTLYNANVQVGEFKIYNEFLTLEEIKVRIKDYIQAKELTKPKYWEFKY